mgnify:FL=1
MVKFYSLAIASGEALSAAFPFNGLRVAAVVVPAAWTDADISFEVEYPSGTWVKVVNRAGALYKLTGVATAASEMQLVSGDANQADVVITGPGDGRLVSTNTGSEANINQGAARTIVVVLAN